MPHVRNALVALALLTATTAFAQMPDLSGAALEQSGVCNVEGDVQPCSVYEKGGVRYLVFRDEGEIVLIFRVHAGASPPYRQNDYDLIWSKDDDQVLET